MSLSDPIDQVGRGPGGESLGEMERHADEMTSWFEEMAAVADAEVAVSPGAGMDEGALFEACKRARVPGLIVGDERMSDADMRRALVVAVKREVAVSTARALAVAQAMSNEAPPPIVLQPHVPAVAKPVPPEPDIDGLEPSRNGKYTVRVPGGGRRYVSIGGHLNTVSDGGEVDLRTFPRRDVETILRAGVLLEPQMPVYRSVTVKLRVPVDVDSKPAEDLLAMIAAEISDELERDPERVTHEAQQMRERNERRAAEVDDEEVEVGDDEVDAYVGAPDGSAPTADKGPAKRKRKARRG